MKKLLLLALTLALVFGAMPVLASGPVTEDYGNVVIPQWNWSNFGDIWDLTQCNLALSYTIDMSEIASPGWSVTEVGLREVGAPNIDPNLKGGWMQSNYIYPGSNPNTQDNNDMHFLSKHGWSHQHYDAEDADTLVTPYWSGANYGFWFDRDGVDEWQADLWGNIDGATYNTNGVYEIVITYHAIDANTGTMFATINGVQQGLYIGGWKNDEPEFYPAGRSFTGDMTQMQVFYGRGGGGGTVTVSDIMVTGCLRTVVIHGCDTGVADQVLDGGSLISEKIAECAAVAQNHGQFTSCVARLTNDLKRTGGITGQQKGAIESCAAQADIP